MDASLINIHVLVDIFNSTKSASCQEPTALSFQLVVALNDQNPTPLVNQLPHFHLKEFRKPHFGSNKQRNKT